MQRRAVSPPRANPFLPRLGRGTQTGLQAYRHLNVEPIVFAFQHYLHVIQIIMQAELNRASTVTE
jgi:hypothetical protein